MWKKHLKGYIQAWLLDTPYRPPSAAQQRARAAFHAAVQRYPAHAPPYPGSGREITPEQAQANLDWFRATVPERLNALHGLLAEFQVPTQPEEWTMAAIDTWLARVIAWTQECWPEQPFAPDHRDEKVQLHAERVGDAAIFSITLDLATKLGEIVIVMEPRWRWGLDMNPANLRDGMYTSRRVILTTAPLGPDGIRACEDLEPLVTGRYLEPDDHMYRGPLECDAWVKHMHAACSGRPIKWHIQDT